MDADLWITALRDMALDYAPAAVAVLSAMIAVALAWRECGKGKQ